MCVLKHKTYMFVGYHVMFQYIYNIVQMKFIICGEAFTILLYVCKCKQLPVVTLLYNRAPGLLSPKLNFALTKRPFLIPQDPLPPHSPRLLPTASLRATFLVSVKYLPFCAWFVSLNLVISSSIYVVRYRISSFVMAEYNILFVCV